MVSKMRIKEDNTPCEAKQLLIRKKKMSSFTIEEFRSAMNDFISLKGMYSPYNYQEWKTNLTETESPANRCKRVLERLKGQIESILEKLAVKGAQVYCCKGASYFPKIPWLGVMFEGEAPTDGVYPVLSLYADGFIIGCVESIKRPQRDFVSRCYSFEEIEDGRKKNDAFFKSIDEHCSKKSRWFPFARLNDISAQEIESAIHSAIEDYKDYRGVLAEKTKWFDEKLIDNENQLEKWIIEMSQSNKSLVFRGQGDAKWPLETGLGRSVHGDNSDDRKVDVAKILEFERSALQAFKREIARRPEYAAFADIDVLALMQHYGSRTRLLDFTCSPLVALYMALEQYYGHVGQIETFRKYHPISKEEKEQGQETEKDDISAIAVWAVDTTKFVSPNVAAINELLPDSVNKVPDLGILSEWKRTLLFHCEADTILRADTSKMIKMGIDVVIPNANNERCSAQEGVFLMPRRVSQTFEANLQRAIDDSSTDASWVTKYVFSTGLIRRIQCLLDHFCITAKLIYPDLTGLAKSLNKKEDFRRTSC